MQTKIQGHPVDKKVKQSVKKHINQKIIMSVRLDPCLQGTHGKKRKADKLQITAVLSLNFPVLPEASGV